jgi:hypothetical protein
VLILRLTARVIVFVVDMGLKLFFKLHTYLYFMFTYVYNSACCVFIDVFSFLCLHFVSLFNYMITFQVMRCSQIRSK